MNTESKHLLRDLVTDANKHGLVLFVGSGINPPPIPQWSRLLGGLVAQAIQETTVEDPRIDNNVAKWLAEWCGTHFDVCAQASIVKRILGSERYRTEMQHALYGEASDIEDVIRAECRAGPSGRAQYDLLRAVAELCSLPQVKAVATFNFDTLLECAIAAYGKKEPRSYFGDTASVGDLANSRRGVIPVFHIHGLLSSPDVLRRNPSEAVVLSYDEYFDKNANPLSWETATPLHLLRHFCTLWVGASLKDWNMLRLLDAASSGRTEVHAYCIQCLQEVQLAPPRLPHSAEAGRRVEQACRALHQQWRTFQKNMATFQELALRFQATLFDTVGMRLVVAGKDYSCIPRTISRCITSPLKTLINTPRKTAKGVRHHAK